ncbi:hypothetical protein B0H11DRAFT_1932719 [Mycena galericulata]|nr:hypothetical protein B0H11DRAFT_1932719 [Mycena galericulata]
MPCTFMLLLECRAAAFLASLGMISLIKILPSRVSTLMLHRLQWKQFYDVHGYSLQWVLVRITCNAGSILIVHFRLLASGGEKRNYAHIPFIAGDILDEGDVSIHVSAVLYSSLHHKLNRDDQGCGLEEFAAFAVPKPALAAAFGQILEPYPDITALGVPYNTGTKYHEWKNAFFIKCLSPIWELEAVALRSLHQTTRMCCGLTLSRATSMHPGRSRTPLQLHASSSCDVLY